MGLRMRVHDREPIGAALRRFKKLIERSGMKGEIRAHEYYEKPCDTRRRKESNRLRAIKKAALGKPVKYVPVPVVAMVESLTKMGLDDYNQVALRDYFTAYSRGWESQVTSAVKDLTGIEARGIAEFARDHAAAFGKR